MNLIPILVALFLVFSSAPALAQVSVEDVANPRDSNSWVTDSAELMTPDEERKLDTMIDAIHAEQGIEITVVTVYSVDTATPKDFATELFNYWGIGDARSDNGLLVLMVVSERRLEMETGYGTEAVLTDAWLKAMQEDLMVPRFKTGEFGSGLIAGVAASIERLRKYPNGIPEGMAAEPYDDGELPVPWWVLVGSTLLGLGGAGSWYKHRRDRTCVECGERMTMLPDEEDDDILTAGQQTEEAIGSVDYEYWYCETDSFSRLLKINKWFSGYTDCPRCRNRTLKVTSHTVSYPTYTSTGTEEINEDCAHCDYHNTRYRTLPRKTRSTSSSSSSGFSSSSGGSSFGGGSSGGGGAGSSW